MKKVLSVLADHNLKYLPCEKINLDWGQDEEYKASNERLAENPFELNAHVSNKIQVEARPEGVESILTYFLDGSRKTYRIADLLYKGKYLPIIAGQVGVAVVRRVQAEKHVVPVRDFCTFSLYLAIPDWLPPDDAQALEQDIHEKTGVRVGVLQYEAKQDRDPVDLGIAKIMSEMHNLEIKTVQRMVAENKLNNYSVLVIDGPLRFKKKFDLMQFRNVIGISKSFKPSFSVGQGKAKIHVGTITSQLDAAQRTPVFRSDDEDKIIGMWYLRLRKRKLMSNPLQGIIKIERLAVTPDEMEDGFDSELIDTISCHVMAERNVTPYGVDNRWASHIYPVYCAETFLKSSFLSDLHFVSLF